MLSVLSATFPDARTESVQDSGHHAVRKDIVIDFFRRSSFTASAITSITYKLKLNGGDVKSVQGDSGHAQAKMVTDQYSHILDEDRRTNAQLFEDAFCSGKESAADNKKGAADEDKTAAGVPEGIDPATLAKILTNLEMASLLKALANSIS